LHWAVVPLSFPQDRAATSKTDSNRRDGVLYGFFPAGDSGDFWFEVLLVFNDPSQDSVPDGRIHKCPLADSCTFLPHYLPK
jgi:hypothetical protein